MSIASAITAAQGRVADCYTAISNKGGTLPVTQNLSNMPATIASIPSGGSTKYGCTVDNLLGDVDANGKLQAPSDLSGNLTFTGVEDVNEYVLYYKFYRCKNLKQGVGFPDLVSVSGAYGLSRTFALCENITSISFPELTTIGGNYGCEAMFSGCSGLSSITLPKLTTVSSSDGCFSMFSSCNQVTSISLPELTTVSGSYSCSSMFSGCYILNSVSVPKLSTISGNYACSYMFSSCQNLASVSFPQLTTLTGNGGCISMFTDCWLLRDIYFNSLTTTSFGYNVNQFNNLFDSKTSMISGTCTMHFPSNLESTIQGLTGYPYFGGRSTRIVLSFDLPATS